jgi:hypothetical protein
MLASRQAGSTQIDVHYLKLEESISHIFINYAYADYVFWMVHKELRSTNIWNNQSLKECLKLWLEDKTVLSYQSMSCFLLSSLWQTRNYNIFRDVDIPPEVVAGFVINFSKDFKIEPKQRNLAFQLCMRWILRYLGDFLTGPTKATPDVRSWSSYIYAP